MRYSRDQVKPMTQDEYEFATCNAGFSLEFHGKQLGCPLDKSTFGGAIVFAPEAVDYLKRVGLLDNGQRPLCYVREETLCINCECITVVPSIMSASRSVNNMHDKNKKNGPRGCLVVVVIIALPIWEIVKLVS